MKAATFPCSVKSATGVHRCEPQRGVAQQKKSEIKEKQRRQGEKNTLWPPPTNEAGRHMPVQYLSIKGSRDNSKGHSVQIGC